MKKFVLLILLFLFKIKGQHESEFYDKNFVGDQKSSSQYQMYYYYYRCRRICNQMYWPYYERRGYDYGHEWYRKMERNDDKTPQRKLSQLKN